MLETDSEKTTGYVIGYASLCGGGPTLTEQASALRAVGVSKRFMYFYDTANSERRQLRYAMKAARPGDVFVVTNLVCLAHSMKQLGSILHELANGGIDFHAINDRIDTRTSTGKLFVSVLLAHIDMRSSAHRAKTNAGIALARNKGRHGGRPKVLTPEVIAAARCLIADGGCSMADVAAKLNVSRSSLYNAGLRAYPRCQKKGRPHGAA